MKLVSLTLRQCEDYFRIKDGLMICILHVRHNVQHISCISGATLPHVPCDSVLRLSSVWWMHAGGLHSVALCEDVTLIHLVLEKHWPGHERRPQQADQNPAM